MKSKIYRIQGFSEEIMGDFFAAWINNPKGLRLSKKDYVGREIRCKQGIPDFILGSGIKVKKKQLRIISDLFEFNGEGYIQIISLLKYKAPRTEGYLTKKSGISRTVVRRILRKLVDEKVISKTDTGSYIISKSWRLPASELWAFELKLKDWKRALYQAQQYKAFASRIVVVFPEKAIGTILSNIDAFKKMNLGIIVFYGQKNEFNYILKPKKIKPLSKRHYLYAFSKLAIDKFDSNHVPA